MDFSVHYFPKERNANIMTQQRPQTNNLEKGGKWKNDKGKIASAQKEVAPFL